MAKSLNQKGKLVILLDILSRKTDENHKLNTTQLIAELDKYEISVERKTIYADVATLVDLGYDIMLDKSKNGGYYMASRKIEKYELEPLVDAVSSSKFITEKKSRELIQKLAGLLSEYEAKDLARNVYVGNRIKTDNESVYYVVDAINAAISTKRNIEFNYCEWDINKQLVPRYDGKKYVVSPMALIWDNESYYLIAYSPEHEGIRHYRIDKMKNIVVTKDVVEDCDTIRKFDPVKYYNKTFGMYGGVEEYVTIMFPSSMAGVCIDRFGKEPTFRPMMNDKSFSVRVNVVVSSQFFGWIAGLGPNVKIMGPENVVEQYKEYLTNIIATY